MCHRAIGRTWGLRPALSLWLYRSVIRPCLDYGSLVWVTGSEVGLKKALLEKVQRLALLMTTSACRTTPTAGLEAILNVPPVDIFLKGQAMRSWRRLIRTDSACFTKTSASGHVRWIQSHIKSVPLTAIPQVLRTSDPELTLGTNSTLAPLQPELNGKTVNALLRKQALLASQTAHLNGVRTRAKSGLDVAWSSSLIARSTQ